MRCGFLVASAGAFAILAASPANSATFAFDNLVNTVTDFSISAGGLTATFASSTGPGTFAVAQPVGQYSFPVALGDYGAFQGDPLTITFSDPVMDTLLDSVRDRAGIRNRSGNLGRAGEHRPDRRVHDGIQQSTVRRARRGGRVYADVGGQVGDADELAGLRDRERRSAADRRCLAA